MSYRWFFWRRFWDQEWTKAHLVWGESGRALCGETVDHASAREDENPTEKSQCKKCRKAKRGEACHF